MSPESPIQPEPNDSPRPRRATPPRATSGNVSRPRADRPTRREGRSTQRFTPPGSSTRAADNLAVDNLATDGSAQKRGSGGNGLAWVAQGVAIAQKAISGLTPVLERFWQTLRPLFERVRPAWGNLIQNIRRRLPASVNRNLPDSAITGIVLGVLILLLSIASGISDKPAVARSTPTPIASAPAKPVPPPVLDRTPEPELIAALQEQVSQVTNRYSEGLIQSVQVNFRRDRLTVQVGDGWYSLAPDRQNALAQDLLGRSKELNFSRLDMTDVDGTLVARSPFVGDTAVVLQRAIEGL